MYEKAQAERAVTITIDTCPYTLPPERSDMVFR